VARPFMVLSAKSAAEEQSTDLDDEYRKIAGETQRWLQNMRGYCERRCAHDRLFGPDRRSTSSTDVMQCHKGWMGSRNCQTRFPGPAKGNRQSPAEELCREFFSLAIGSSFMA